MATEIVPPVESTEPTATPAEPVVEPAPAPEQPPAAVDPTPPVEPTPEPAPWSLREAGQTHGIDPSAFESDESMATAMFTALNNAQDNEALAKIGRQFAPYADNLDKFREWEISQAASAAEVEPEPAVDPFVWESPEYNPRWEGMVEPDGRGGYKAPDDAPELSGIAAKLTTHRQFQTERLTQFLGNPQELIHTAMTDQLSEMEKRIMDASSKAIETAMQKQVEAAEAQRFISDQEKDLFQFDANDQPMFDTQGNQIPTPKGRAMAGYFDEMTNAGATDQAKIREIVAQRIAADEAAGLFEPSAPVQPIQPAPVVPPPKKTRFVNRLLPSNNRAGTVPDPTAPTGSHQQNPSASMDDITRRIASEQGVQL